jgi:hypothetical protein
MGTEIPPEVLAALKQIYQGMGEFAGQENARDLKANYGAREEFLGARDGGQGPAEIEPVPGAVGDDNIPDQGVEKGMETDDIDPALLAKILAAANG